ncbi:MAG: DUF5723 family protein [candidate division WOR-3 bacterium]|nr:DUF5723 family protein [candidate division WOR-3 bacterium]MDW7987500.1 DUF5723 family protein [candidate division WOR-3 bacterium]
MKIILALLFVFQVGQTLFNPSFVEPWYSTTKSSHRYNLELLRVWFNLTNNSLNLNNYLYYFDKHPNWNTADKNNLLSYVPLDGFKTNLALNLIPFGFYTKSYNISVYTQNQGNLSFPKNLFELILNGNEINRTYNFKNIRFNGMSYIGITAGVNYPIITNFNWINKLSSGLQFHFQRGLAVTFTDSADGNLVTTPENLFVRLYISQKLAQNGNCAACDCFTTFEFSNNINLTIALLNLSTGFYWQDNCRLVTYEVLIDSVNFDYYLKKPFIDSVVNFISQVNTLNSFKTKIPPQIFLYCDVALTPYIKSAIYYHHYLARSVFINDFAKQLNLSLYYYPSEVVNLKISVATDLCKNFYFVPGLKLLLKKFYINLALPQYNGILTKTKGLALCFSSGFYF